MDIMQQELKWTIAAQPSEPPTDEVRLMEKILERDNMWRAFRQVRRNKGAPGVDGMTVKQLGGYLRRHWLKVKRALLDGQYKPLPVRRKEIDKPEGGVRLLGIPAVLDRLIQQAISQVLVKLWEPTFSDSSFGFRPGRSAHDALRCAQQYVQNGCRYVVDLDLSKFFDRVNHDRLMSRLATRVHDKRVLKLIRSFLNAGVMVEGLTESTDTGVPQGGPLSPLLSNVVLDELDKEFEQRGLCSVRYGDDIAIYVRSKSAGDRVLNSVTRFLEHQMKLRVNADKSGVHLPWHSKLLGFTLTNAVKNPKIRLHWKTVKRLKARIRELTKRSCGRSLQRVINDLMVYLRGWWNYFRLTQSFNRLRGIDGWIYRRLRALVWKQWKTCRNRKRELLKRGVSPNHAGPVGATRKGPWRLSQNVWVAQALPRRYFDGLGLAIPWISPA